MIRVGKTASTGGWRAGRWLNGADLEVRFQRKGASERVRTVLLIDDDPVVTSMYGKMLREQGFDVEIAGNGEEGLEAVRRRMPDVVLLDLDMPKVSGISWLKTIRSRVRSKNLPVVILTAGRKRKQLREAKQSDAVFVLSKTTVRPHIVVEALTAAASTNGSVKVWT
jgi:CheY-like chemotaxis protein